MLTTALVGLQQVQSKWQGHNGLAKLSQQVSDNMSTHHVIDHMLRNMYARQGC